VPAFGGASKGGLCDPRVGLRERGRVGSGGVKAGGGKGAGIRSGKKKGTNTDISLENMFYFTTHVERRGGQASPKDIFYLSSQKN